MKAETAQGEMIAFQGELGANSHRACLEYAPEMSAQPYPTFEDVFEAVAQKKARAAMIPIENSLAGRVSAIHHLLPRSGLHIVGEHFEQISYALLGLPDAQLSDLKSVYSHIMALGQCRRIIRELGLTPVATGDTAGAAREISEEQDRTQAAIAPQRAAEIYGLKVLRDNIEDHEHNITRFLILAREAENISLDRRMITSFIFRVRNVPAALYKALGGFASNGVNMIRLESGQIEYPFHVTQFYADIEGHLAQDNVIGAMDELKFFSETVHILGTYPESPFRTKIRETA